MEEFEPELPNFEADPSFLLPDEPVEPDVVPQVSTGDLRDLVEIGHLTSSEQVFGHEFVLRTILPVEEFVAASIISKWGGTLAETKAFQAAYLAASIVSVDGRPMTRPLGPSVQEVGAAQLKNFNYIITKWHWPIIDRIYDAFAGLVLRQNDALEELEGKS